MTKKRGTYEVGYGKPPVHTRFRKGVSGNPAGKRAPTQYTLRDANRLIMEEAFRQVSVRDGDKIVKIPMFQAVVRSHNMSTVKGNGPAQRGVIKLVAESAEVMLRNRGGEFDNMSDEELDEFILKKQQELKSLAKKMAPRAKKQRSRPKR
jgi:Family of unknown function (DUF5681)